MTITEKILQIRNAVYGKDVREGIASGIEECYNTASIDHDNANMEVSLARGIYATLDERLDQSDSSLADMTTDLDSANTQLKNIGIDIKTYGVIGNSATDDIIKIQQAIDEVSASGGGKLIFPQSSGDYAISNHVKLRSNVVIEFTGSSYLKLTQPSTTGSVLTHDPTVTTENVLVINPLIDANNIVGTNGIGMGGNGTSKNIKFISGHIKNCIRTGASGGGKAITCQLGISDVIAIGVIIDDCTTALDIHGINALDGTGGTQQATSILYTDMVINNCCELFSGYETAEVGSNNPLINSAMVNNIMAFNVGEAETVGDGGVFVFDRGSNVQFSNIKIVNEPSYGKIAGLYRGRSYNVTMDNVKFYGECESLFNGLRANAVSSDATPVNKLLVRNFEHIGTTDYVVRSAVGGSTKMVQCYFQNIHLDVITSAILDTEASAKTDCYGDFIQRSSGKRRMGKFNIITLYGDNGFSGAETYWDCDTKRISKVILSTDGTIAKVGSVGAMNLSLQRNNVEIASLTSSGFKVPTGTWNGNHFILGSYHMWIDAVGKLRIKASSPTTDLDGAVVGTQS